MEARGECRGSGTDPTAALRRSMERRAGDATQIIYARVSRRWNSQMARLPDERTATSIVVCSVAILDGHGELVGAAPRRADDAGGIAALRAC